MDKKICIKCPRCNKTALRKHTCGGLSCPCSFMANLNRPDKYSYAYSFNDCSFFINEKKGFTMIFRNNGLGFTRLDVVLPPDFCDADRLEKLMLIG